MIELPDLIDMIDHDIFENGEDGIFLPLETAERVVEELRNKETVVETYTERQKALDGIVESKVAEAVSDVSRRLQESEAICLVFRRHLDDLSMLHDSVNKEKEHLSDRLMEANTVIQRYADRYGPPPPSRTEIGNCGRVVSRVHVEGVAATRGKSITVMFAEGGGEQLTVKDGQKFEEIQRNMLDRFGTQIDKFLKNWDEPQW